VALVRIVERNRTLLHRLKPTAAGRNRLEPVARRWAVPCEPDSTGFVGQASVSADAEGPALQSAVHFGGILW
jgi:hypothetical protein